MDIYLAVDLWWKIAQPLIMRLGESLFGQSLVDKQGQGAS